MGFLEPRYRARSVYNSHRTTPYTAWPSRLRTLQSGTGGTISVITPTNAGTTDDTRTIP